MAAAGPPIAIAELRRLLKRAESRGRSAGQVVAFDVPSVDRVLPGGGLQLGHVHEIVEAGSAASFASLATLFTAGIVARIPGPVLWCLRGRDLFAPALSRIGLHPSRVIYCETWNDRDVLPAMEEGLRCKGLAAVIGEVTRLSLNASRRLQLCAEETGVTSLIIRRWRNTREKEFASEPSASATRWRIAPHPSPGESFEGLERQCWRVELLRVRGGEPREWILEACDAQGRLALPAALADRPAAAAEPGYRRAG